MRSRLKIWSLAVIAMILCCNPIATLAAMHESTAEQFAEDEAIEGDRQDDEMQQPEQKRLPEEITARNKLLYEGYGVIDMIFTPKEYYEVTQIVMRTSGIESALDDLGLVINIYVYKDQQVAYSTTALPEDLDVDCEEALSYLDGLFDIKVFRHEQTPVLVQQIFINTEDVANIKDGSLFLSQGFFLLPERDGVLIKTDNDFWISAMTYRFNLDGWITGEFFDVLAVNCIGPARSNNMTYVGEEQLLKAGLRLTDDKWVEFSVVPSNHSDFLVYGLPLQKHVDPFSHAQNTQNAL